MKAYKIFAGMGYGEYLRGIRLKQTENGYDYLIIERNCHNKDDNDELIIYDLEDVYVQEDGEIVSEIYEYFKNW